MTDIAVVILTGNEELHIKRCLERLAPLEPRQVFIVESQKGDRTHDLAIETAKELGWSLSPSTVSTYFNLMWHNWPGLYAPQMNWGIEQVANQSNAPKWTIRLDADEYFLPETIVEIKRKIETLAVDVTGIVFKRRHYIFGGWAKRGTYPVNLLRMWRTGHGKCEERFMDEHIVVDGGRVVEFDGDLVDCNLNSFSWWMNKHRGYARREALDALEIISELKSGNENGIPMPGQAGEKRAKKYRYYSLPPYVRAFLYWSLRYIKCGGILDGITGLMWDGFQGFWYRSLVDTYVCREICYPWHKRILWRGFSLCGLTMTLVLLSPLILLSCLGAFKSRY